MTPERPLRALRAEVSAAPQSARAGAPLPLRIARRDAADAFERDYLRTILEHAQGNVTRAAAIAEVSRQMIQKLARAATASGSSGTQSPSEGAFSSPEASTEARYSPWFILAMKSMLISFGHTASHFAAWLVQWPNPSSVHLRDHLERARSAARLALRQEREVRDLGGGEQRRRKRWGKQPRRRHSRCRAPRPRPCRHRASAPGESWPRARRRCGPRYTPPACTMRSNADAVDDQIADHRERGGAPRLDRRSRRRP